MPYNVSAGTFRFTLRHVTKIKKTWQYLGVASFYINVGLKCKGVICFDKL